MPARFSAGIKVRFFRPWSDEEPGRPGAVLRYKIIGCLKPEQSGQVSNDFSHGNTGPGAEAILAGHFFGSFFRLSAHRRMIEKMSMPN